MFQLLASMIAQFSLPVGSLHPWAQSGLLAIGTFASEDLTCIAAGQLIRQGGLHWFAAIFGCVMGIFLGDLGLFALGRLAGRTVAGAPWLARRLPAAKLDQLGNWYDRNCASAILAARFLPGARLPLYFAAGTMKRSATRFALWTLVASLLWTPLLVFVVACFGDAMLAPLRAFLGGGWIGFLAAILAAWLILKIIALSLTAIGRGKLIARFSRIWRWEFWPMWLFYAPLLPWIGWLSIRHRGLLTITAANPGIPHGGFVGESKSQIISSLRTRFAIPTILIEPADPVSRLARIEQAIADRDWTYPLIFKPDAGQRGAGVKLVRSMDDAQKYLSQNPGPIIVQAYHPGPFEAGVFYYRIPGEARGHIFSITDKRFPELLGDGRSTMQELIWRHPRLRMQAGRFIERHADQRDRVLESNERFQLALAGNHCQGTLFGDGSRLLTPALESSIDSIAKSFDGFYFGRFDIRYSNVEAFMAGEDLAIIELNGITSESTNIYDPGWSIFRAYRMLFRQWEILFRIGAANRRRGYSPSTVGRLWHDVRAYYSGPRPAALAD